MDESLNTYFDFYYWLRAFLAYPGRIFSIDFVQTESRLHESGITLHQHRKVLLEGMQVLAKILYFPHQSGC